MLRNVNELQGFGIVATDGALGSVEEFYFDDERWTIRYLVIDTGKWLPGRKVLISPFLVREIDWTRRTVAVSVTRDQVKNSPDIDTHKPVSRQHEAAYLGYYGYPYYWGSTGLWGPAPFPTAAATAHVAAMEGYAEAQRHTSGNQEDEHLRRTKEVNGYGLHATDGELGHVADFLIDDGDWAIRYLVVNTGNWWFGQKVLVSPDWIEAVSWTDRKVSVRVTRQAVKDAPKFDVVEHIDRQWETDYAAYYERAGDSVAPRSAAVQGDVRPASKLVSLNAEDEFEVAHGEADPRGWEVVASGTGRIGTVNDLIADTETMKVRYLNIGLDDAAAILLPVAYVRLGDEEHRVTLDGLNADDLRRVPGYSAQPVSTSYDEEFGGYTSGGRMAVREPRERTTAAEWSIGRRKRHDREGR